MSRKYGPITVEAYVAAPDGGFIDVDTLPAERRAALADALSVAFLNAAYAGTAVFNADSSRKGSGSTSG